MDIAKDRPEALSLGYRYYHGNECKHCHTTVKRVKKYDCLQCHHKGKRESLYRYQQSPKGRALKKTYRRLDKANRKQAMVSWADMDKIAAIYKEAQERGLHVDHSIPLRHDLVCGLHVYENLQLLDPAENIRKSNHFEIL